jgi:hypothetical protein
VDDLIESNRACSVFSLDTKESKNVHPDGPWKREERKVKLKNECQE